MTEALKFSMYQTVRVGEPPAPAAEGEQAAPDLRRSGEVRGLQDLEHPISYLIKYADEKSPPNEWVREAHLSAK